MYFSQCRTKSKLHRRRSVLLMAKANIRIKPRTNYLSEISCRWLRPDPAFVIHHFQSSYVGDTRYAACSARRPPSTRQAEAPKCSKDCFFASHHLPVLGKSSFVQTTSQRICTYHFAEKGIQEKVQVEDMSSKFALLAATMAVKTFSNDIMSNTTRTMRSFNSTKTNLIWNTGMYAFESFI